MIYKFGYSLVLWLALPWILMRLWWRGLGEPDYRKDVLERFGFYRGNSVPRTLADSRCIWIHAVSMGETNAARSLIFELVEANPDCHLLITHMTATGRQAAHRMFAGLPNVTFSWLPYDFSFAVRRFMARFRPKVGILLETEIWPNLLSACAESGVPAILANARLSDKSRRKYSRIAPLIRMSLGSFAAIAAQTQEDVERLISLGAVGATTHAVGNLKFDLPIEADHSNLSDELRHRFGPRPVFLAASTREGEETLILRALLDTKMTSALPADWLVVIVPRHPQRFGEVATLLMTFGIPFVKRSDNVDVDRSCKVVLGDSLGEMSAYYAAADCTFVGGSLLPFGGQNLIEACAVGTPVLVGNHTYNFSRVAELAIAEGAAIRVQDTSDLLNQVARLLSDAELRARMSEAAIRYCSRYRGATSRTVQLMEAVLARVRGSSVADESRSG